LGAPRYSEENILTTSLLDRAKALIKSQARRGALAIVPLAAAVPAHAGNVVLPTSDFSCQITDEYTTGSSCPSISAGVTQLGAGGVSFSLASGGLVLAGNGTLEETTAGQVATAIPIGTTISYSYDFFLSYNEIDPNWELTLVVADEGASPGPATEISGSPTITGTYGESRTEFSGSGSFVTTTSTNANDYLEVYFNLDLSGLDGSANTTVEIPAGTSIDFDTPTSSSGVPSHPVSACSAGDWRGSAGSSGGDARNNSISRLGAARSDYRRGP
jgi:hypothetical protein